MPISTPKVSVLMPTLNYARFLPEAIESVLNQTFTDFEMIIVDNGSTDDTDDVVQPYLSDERVQYYKNPVRGMGSNWNVCLDYSKGTYIKFICADDKFHPYLLEKFVDVMDTYANVSIVTSYRGIFGREETAKDNRTFSIWQSHQHLQEGGKVIKHTLQTFNWIGEPTAVMFRRSNLHLGYFRTDLQWMAEWEMWLRHLTVGDCYLVPEVLSYIRKHNGSMTNTICKNAYFNYFEDYDFYTSVASDKYQFDLTKDEAQQLVKKGARNCAKAMLKSIPRLHQKSFRSICIKGFRIAYKEKVIIDTIWQVWRNSFKRSKLNRVDKNNILPTNRISINVYKQGLIKDNLS